MAEGLIHSEERGEILLYQPDDSIRLEVRLQGETVWLTQQQMAELFGTQRQAVTKHLKNIYDSGELSKNATSSILELVRQEGGRQVRRKIEFYNLDAIISVGFRINTRRGIMFRQWANAVLKDYLLRGFAVHQQALALQQINLRIDAQNDRLARIEDTIDQQQQQLDFVVRSNEKPEELLGTSVKDMGRSLCTIIKVGFSAEQVLKMVNG